MNNFKELLKNLESVTLDINTLKNTQDKNLDPVALDFIKKNFYYNAGKFDFNSFQSIETYDILLTIIECIHNNINTPSSTRIQVPSELEGYVRELFRDIFKSNLSQDIQNAKTEIGTSSTFNILF